jgi:RNA polymerase primary sigma factor
MSLEDEALSPDDPLQVYLAELHKIPPLARDEEIVCVAHVRAEDEMPESSKIRLCEANLLLVVSIAQRYRNDRVRILDLIQRGNDGLMQAVRTVSDSVHDSFSAHAAGYIERAIAEAATSGSNEI